MTDVQMDRAEVERAAERVGAAAATVESAGHGDTVGDLAAALPGSLSAAAAQRLTAAWTQGSAVWVASARLQEHSLSASAAATEATDHRSAENLSRLTSRLGPVPQ